MRKVLYILGRLADEDIDWLTETGARERAPAGTTLVREGTPVDRIFMVLEGELAVTSSRTGARELARLGSGEVVGELSFLDARPPVATVTAATDARVLAIPRDELSAKLDEDAPFAARFYRALGTFLAARLRSTVLELGDARASGPAASAEREDELDPALLDTLELAGARFDWMLGRLRGE